MKDERTIHIHLVIPETSVIRFSMQTGLMIVGQLAKEKREVHPSHPSSFIPHP